MFYRNSSKLSNSEILKRKMLSPSYVAAPAAKKMKTEAAVPLLEKDPWVILSTSILIIILCIQILSFDLKFLVCPHVSIRRFWNPVCPYPEKRNNPCFVNNISSTLIIYASMEKSSRLLHHGNMEEKSSRLLQHGLCLKLNFDMYFEIFDLCSCAKITLAS